MMLNYSQRASGCCLMSDSSESNADDGRQAEPEASGDSGAKSRRSKGRNSNNGPRLPRVLTGKVEIQVTVEVLNRWKYAT